MARWQTHAIAIAADTNVQVAGGTAGDVSTRARQVTVKWAFVPTADAAVVFIAEDSASLTAGEGFPVFSDATTTVASGDDWKLTSDDEVWVRATEAGTLYVHVIGV